MAKNPSQVTTSTTIPPKEMQPSLANLALKKEELEIEDSASKRFGKWTSEEDEILKKYVPLYGEKQWKKIAEHIPGRSSIQCLHRWSKILKPGLIKGPWTADEDQKLVNWVKAEGPNKWAQAANLIKGRSGKQCRERWFNNLNPDVKKGNWSKEEDEMIFDLYQKYGSVWSKISKYLPGRTENAIKNRFYSTLRKLAADKRKHKGEDEVSISEEPKEDLKVKKENIEASNLNTLYSLLQDKTMALPLHETDKSSVKIHPENQTSTPVKNDMKQCFNINGERVLIVRDPKSAEKNIVSTAAKIASLEIKEDEPAFEKFLLTVDVGYREEMAILSSDPNLCPFDRLQKRIYSFCQQSTTEPQRPVQYKAPVKMKVEPVSESTSTTTKLTALQKPSSPQDGSHSSGNINTPTISTPVREPKNIVLQGPIIHTTGKGPAANAFNYYNSPKHATAPPIIRPIDPANQHAPYKSPPMPSSLQQPLANKTAPEIASMIVHVNSAIANASNLHHNSLSNILDMFQKIPSESNQDTEKKMALLFQQLYSLESLLTTTRNELFKLENTITDPKQDPTASNSAPPTDKNISTSKN